MVDKIYVDKSTWDIYENSKIMGYQTVNKISRKEQFLVALGLGFKFGYPTELSPGPKDFFLTKFLTEDEIALLWAVAIKEKGSISNIENEDEVFKIAQEYANTGIKYLESIEKQASFDNYLKKFEKIAFEELKEINNKKDND